MIRLPSTIRIRGMRVLNIRCVRVRGKYCLCLQYPVKQLFSYLSLIYSESSNVPRRWVSDTRTPSKPDCTSRASSRNIISELYLNIGSVERGNSCRVRGERNLSEMSLSGAPLETRIDNTFFPPWAV